MRHLSFCDREGPRTVAAVFDLTFHTDPGQRAVTMDLKNVSQGADTPAVSNFARRFAELFSQLTETDLAEILLATSPLLIHMPTVQLHDLNRFACGLAELTEFATRLRLNPSEEP